MHGCTEGNWFYEGAENGGRVLADDDRKTIVHVPPCSPFNDSAIADARLIAAAKRMYSALETMYDEFKWTSESHRQDEANDIAKALLDELRANAKVTGGQPYNATRRDSDAE